MAEDPIKPETWVDLEKILDDAGAIAQATLKKAGGLNPTLFALDADGKCMPVDMVSQDGKADSALEYAARKEFMKQKSKDYRALCLISDVKVDDGKSSGALHLEVVHVGSAELEYHLPYIFSGFIRKAPLYGKMQLVSYKGDK